VFSGNLKAFKRINLGYNSMKSIQNDDDLKQAFLRLESIFQAEEGTDEAIEMEALVSLIEEYENEIFKS
jgi:antitoxin component HigA of HigAB toxin-antitoxin module